MAQQNCAFYASEFLRGPPEYGGKFFVAEHHEEWADLVNEHKRLCVIAARDHGKSHFFTFAYPIWMAEQHPGREGFIFSASQDQAEAILLRIMREVETNPALKHLLPPIRSRWSAHVLEFANRFALHARGYGSRVRGGHPIFIVGDDILNDESAFSERVRAKEIDYFYSAISNMVVPGGQIIVVGTPFHTQDLYGDLEKNKEYAVRRYPAIRQDGSALWPERYPLEVLARKKDEIKSLRFAREYLCQAVLDLASLFPVGLFKGSPTEQHTVRLGESGAWWDAHGITNRFMAVDFAVSSEIGSDYTVIWTMGVDSNGNRWIVDIFRKQGMGFQEQLSEIITAARRYKPGLIYVEANQSQRIWGDELVRLTDLPIKLFHTGDAKNSLEKGIPSLRVLLENRKIRIPRGDDRSIELTNTWIEEMRSHSFASGKVFSVGEHDDCAMSFWICDQAIRGSSFGFSFGEEDGDKEALESVLVDTLEEQDDPWAADAVPGTRRHAGGENIRKTGIIDLDQIDQDIDNPRTLHGDKRRSRPDDGVSDQGRAMYDVARIHGVSLGTGAEEQDDWRPDDRAPRARDLFWR